MLLEALSIQSDLQSFDIQRQLHLSAVDQVSNTILKLKIV